jgi:hypothetical protein
MKILGIGAVVAIILSSIGFADWKPVSKVVDTNNDKGFAVLELFTSEGCSSCPPADALLTRIQREAGNKSIYVLSYHVDYWNRLGWKDSFSRPEYSQRQYGYSHRFDGQVYTPQVILNGSSAFVGSDETAIKKALADALRKTSLSFINLQAQQQSDSVILHYKIAGIVNHEQLVIAVVQKHAVSRVKRGENEGRTLSHAQIVDQLYSFQLTPDGEGSKKIHFSNSLDPQQWEIIAMLQNPDTGVISAASRITFGQP